MNDTYCELIVKRRTTGSALICRFFAVFASAVAIFLSILMFSILGLTAGAFFVWIDMIIFRNTDIEYEYQFFSGNLDIDVIYGKKKRKRARRFDLKKIEVLAPLKSEKLRYYDGKNLKALDYSSGYPNDKKYAFVIPGDEGVIYKVIFEPSEEMVNSIKMYVPSKVHVQ